ncbi:MAG: sodium:proton antiporter [Actinomycetota bacterium]|nr:sodium:proton antiporter [Actinomycetota bacterium]
MSAPSAAPPRRPGEISFATRRRLFACGAVGLAAFLAWGLAGLPDFGDYAGVYGTVLNATAVEQRHATDIITAVNFDYRGLDALGEEFILFAAVVGLALLLREQRDEEEHVPVDDAPGRHAPSPGEAVRVTAVALVGPTVLLAVYLTAHGHLTPGGGFQGGVVAATALLLVYLGGEYMTLRRVRPLTLIGAAEATGAAGFVLLGIGGLVAGGAFLENVLPLGTSGELVSAGTIPLASTAVGLEVAGGFVVLISEFLEQALVIGTRRGRGRHGGARRRGRRR